jgi:DNA-binding response OmpR family regulator
MNEDFTGKNIISIEDNSGAQSTYVKMLEQLGFHIDVAQDGEQGLQMVKQKYYDIILLDIMMPKLNGIALVQKLNEEGVKYGKIIILSNLNNTELADLMKKENKIDEYLIKAEHPPESVGEIVRRNLD